MHAGQIDHQKLGAVAGGSVLGHLLAPGVGGLLAGGLVGWMADQVSQESDMDKKRVFVSFDFENDRALKEFLVGQARLPDSPFGVTDLSLKAASPDWEMKARAAIRRADLVLVVVGTQTYRALGVVKEVAMAREEGVPVVQMIGHKKGDYHRVQGAGTLYRWNWGNLKRLLS